MDLRPSIDITYLKLAKVWADDRSHCVRKKVGAFAVKDTQIIADGYNGMPKAFDNMCELPDGTTNPLVMHAESNLLAKLGKSTQSSVGATLYVTLSPCLECAKSIYQHGIIRVVYAEEYRITDGIDFLKKAGVEVSHVPL